MKAFRNQFKRNHLKSKKLFVNFVLFFWNLDKILNILSKNITFLAYIFSILRTAKDVAR